MYKKFLLALDLEGVNNVCGEAYKGLAMGTDGWEVARRQAAKEINCAAQALFEAGAERVALWDNHGGTVNIIKEELDSRIEYIDLDLHLPRMYFASDNAFDCICFFGYHTMEGTLGGVLAHTMSSGAIQYYKLNGKYIGEVDMDAYIAASHNMPSIFFAAGDLTCKQAKRSLPHIVTVTTKKEISRNEAEYRDNELLFKDIKERITEAANMNAPIIPCPFPVEMEKSFKRVEDAAKYLERLRNSGIEADYLDDEILIKDAHTVVSKINSIEEFITCI
jgi:D-amino peptidase